MWVKVLALSNTPSHTHHPSVLSSHVHGRAQSFTTTSPYSHKQASKIIHASGRGGGGGGERKNLSELHPARHPQISCVPQSRKSRRDHARPSSARASPIVASGKETEHASLTSDWRVPCGRRYAQEHVWRCTRGSCRDRSSG